MELKNKKVLVTGSCGFIGSHLVERLLEEGCLVKAFVYYNSFNSWGWLDTFPKEKLNQIEIFVVFIWFYEDAKESNLNFNQNKGDYCD